MAKPIILPVFKTYTIDHGWNRITAEAKKLNGSYTKVGLPAGGKTSGRYSMNKLVEVAHDNEFGLTVPERSFIRAATDENRTAINHEIDKGVNAIISGTATVKGVLNHIGDKVKQMIILKIMTGPFARLHPNTAAKKGHEVPLYETGQLITSIQHKDKIRGAV